MSISTEQSGAPSHAEDEFNDSITSDTPTLCEVELGFRQSTSTDIEAHQQSRPTRSFFSFFNFVRTSGTSRTNNQDVYNNYNDNISQLEQQQQQPKRRFWKSLLGPETDNKEEDTNNDADTTFTAFTVVDNDPSNKAIASHSSPYQNRNEAWQTFKRVATSCYNEIKRMAIFFLNFFYGLAIFLIVIGLGVITFIFIVFMIANTVENFPTSIFFPIPTPSSFITFVEYLYLNLLYFLLSVIISFASLAFFILCGTGSYFVLESIWDLIYNFIKGN